MASPCAVEGEGVKPEATATEEVVLGGGQEEEEEEEQTKKGLP